MKRKPEPAPYNILREEGPELLHRLLGDSEATGSGLGQRIQREYNILLHKFSTVESWGRAPDAVREMDALFTTLCGEIHLLTELATYDDCSTLHRFKKYQQLSVVDGDNIFEKTKQAHAQIEAARAPTETLNTAMRKAGQAYDLCMTTLEMRHLIERYGMPDEHVGVQDFEERTFNPTLRHNYHAQAAMANNDDSVRRMFDTLNSNLIALDEAVQPMVLAMQEKHCDPQTPEGRRIQQTRQFWFDVARDAHLCIEHIQGVTARIQQDLPHVPLSSKSLFAAKPPEKPVPPPPTTETPVNLCDPRGANVVSWDKARAFFKK